MKILMLGWEYPPHIAGGLGTACEGLTSALSDQGIAIHFVVPRLYGDEQVDHMTITDSTLLSVNAEDSDCIRAVSKQAEAFETTRIPAFLTPYWSPQQFREAVIAATQREWASLPRAVREEPVAKALIEGEVFGVDLVSAFAPKEPVSGVGSPQSRHASDIFSEVERFTADVLGRFSSEKFDIIHAHDWMTFPAAVALAETTGKPLVTHVHSLEYDRSGLFVNETINEIERFGLEAAQRIIAVSHYTKRSIERYHGIAAKKIAVVHNGIYPRQAVADYRKRKRWPRHVVLFLGRVTYHHSLRQRKVDQEHAEGLARQPPQSTLGPFET